MERVVSISSKTFLISAFVLMMILPGCYMKGSQDPILGGAIDPAVAAGPPFAGCGDGTSVCTNDSFIRANSVVRLGVTVNNLTDALFNTDPNTRPMPYFIAAGTWGINANEAKPLALAGGFSTALVDVAFTNCTISTTTIVQSTGGLSGVMFRHDNTNNDLNTWVVYADKTGIMGAPGYYLVRIVAGVPATVAQATAFTPANGDEIQVTTNGPVITVNTFGTNGSAVLNALSATFVGNTLHGFTVKTDLTARFSSFEIAQCH